ncbi:MAG: type II toxin-antitoxin system RelE/ParE family toxin [Gemmatimonadetes bacterium]|nr:type II toxin-antitoxin system RelE/ParE family toxin [Gemmatimonadota bacterium]
MVHEKPVTWVGSSHADLRALPAEVRRELGYDLRQVQRGREPRDGKPMATVGAGVWEIRVRVAGAFRLFFVAKFAEAVYVLHVFQKKSQQTPRLDLELGRARYQAVLRERSKGRQVGMAVRMRRGSGNVFVDLGFPPEEAAHLLIRSDLMITLNQALEDRGLTQVRAAKVLGVSQPRVSALRRGKIEQFSIDALVELLARLGVAVTVQTKKRKRVA